MIRWQDALVWRVVFFHNTINWRNSLPWGAVEAYNINGFKGGYTKL